MAARRTNLSLRIPTRLVLLIQLVEKGVYDSHTPPLAAIIIIVLFLNETN